MSATAVINDLKQARSCIGKCDCCQKIQTRLNLLEWKVAAIKPVDEQKIIKQSIAGAEQLILPSVGVAVARALLPIENQIAQINKNLLNFGNTAKQALSRAGTASNLARNATQVAGNAGSLAAKATKVGNSALSVGKGAAKTAGNALAKSGALATAVFSVGASLATLHVLGGRIDAVEGGLNFLGRDVSKILGQILGIKSTAQTAKVDAKNAINKAVDASADAATAKKESSEAINQTVTASKTATEAKTQAKEALATSVKAQTAAQTATGVASTASTTATTASATAISASAAATSAVAIANQALAIAKGINFNPTMDAETRSKLNQLEKLIGNLNVSLPAAIIGSAGFTAAVTSAAATGVCRSTAPGGCLGRSLGNLGSKMNASLIHTAGIGTVSGQVASLQIKAGAISGQVATNGILIKGVAKAVAGLTALAKTKFAAILGAMGGIKALIITKFAATWAFLTTDRTLNVFTAATSLHNAYMLSGSLSQTLFSIVDNIGAILFKDAAGQSFSVSKVLGKGFDDWAKGAVGVTTWEGIKAQWKKFNRIYQAGANIINSVRSMMDSVRNISEFIAENTGRIGNALKRFAVIGGDAFKWMPEQVNSSSIWVQRLENLEEAASGIEMITSEVLSITENVNEIKKQTEIFQKSISESPIKNQTENIAKSEKESEAKDTSKSPKIPQSAERNP